MTTTPRPSREIDGKGRTIRELLAGRKYSIDYYQREYKPQHKQVADSVETRSGMASRYAEYAQRGRKGYEVEHVWADHPERHTDEFAHPSEFQEYRNRIGGLVLLPKSFNASYGDLPYAEKREHYDSQNLLARSLHERAYDHNPGFRRFIEASGLPFHAHAGFRKVDLDARQVLYQRLAERIWSPERLDEEAAS
jgi:hypothetical protein